jgi:galactokinase
MRTRSVSEWALSLARGELDAELAPLYPGETDFRDRYLLVLDAFSRCFPAESPAALVSAPGRTELGGNHTDHQRGRVLAAAVSLDMVAAVSPNGEGRVRVFSEGMPKVDIGLDDLLPKKEEEGTSAALVRGVAAGIAKHGGTIGGFDAAMVSSIPVGAGLSSSAAYEILIGTIFNELYNGGALLPVQLASIGHTAENVYFNKPCGMMDQTACAVGGVVAIDFRDPKQPEIERIACDFNARGYRLFITNAGGSHADLTDEYAAIPREMRAVASALGAQELRSAAEEEFYRKLPALRRQVGDRAVLRAMHFFDENRRAKQEADALRAGDLQTFAALMRESGASSELMLQNIWPGDQGQERSVALALGLSARLLAGKGGAWRVHGGGFAGTIQALVPESAAGEYMETMNRLMNSAAACRGVGIRPVGGYAIRGGI